MITQNFYQDFDIENLQINSENPRMLEELTSEGEAINFLLTDIPERMKKLAQDIVEHSTVFDPPLVRQEGGYWKVYDGNRRIACVKLLNNPALAEDPTMLKYFTRLAETYSGKIPNKINCRVETDLAVINDILERRHAGGDSGIGQMPWKPEEKANFYYREGLDHRPKFGTELSRMLQDKGIIQKGDRIKVSIFDRLLSSEGYRNKVGLTFKGRKLAFIADEDQSLASLTRIVEDARSGTVNLNKTWANQDKDAYLKNLEDQGFLPKKSSVLPPTNNDNDKQPGANPQPELESNPKLKKQTYNRPKLIPENLAFTFDDNDGTTRIRNVVGELQNDLYFSKHLNAIAVLFRVLIEMCVDHYLTTNGIQTISKDKYGASLATKFSACLEDMVRAETLTDKDRKVLVKFSQPEQILSADTFNAWVHHRLAHPIQSDLVAMWDQLEPYILNCVHVKAAKKRHLVA